jgi:hypothetical protein
MCFFGTQAARVDVTLFSAEVDAASTLRPVRWFVYKLYGMGAFIHINVKVASVMPSVVHSTPK